MKSYFSLFRNYANFSGYMKRGNYWTAMIIHTLILAVPLYPLIRFLADSSYTLPSFYIPWVLPIWCFYFLLMIIPVWSAAVRRLHTLPRRGWWLLIGLIPVIGWFIILIWLLQKGTYEEIRDRLKRAGINNALIGNLNRALAEADKPRKGGWFFAVFALLAAGGWFLNRQIIKSGSQEELMASIRSISAGDLSTIRPSGGKSAPSVPAVSNGPVYLLEPSGDMPITALTDGSELLLIQDGVLASRYAVTYAQYSDCVKAGVCEMPASVNVDAYQPLDKNLITFIRNNGISHFFQYFSLLGEDSLSYPVDGKLPMVDVTVEQAAAYCQWAGMRLPTVSEWKEASKGAELSDKSANCVGTSRWWVFRHFEQAKAQIAQTIPVNSYDNYAGEYGPVQMAGNVWEWTAPDPDSAVLTAMGGAWNSYPGGTAAEAVYEVSPGFSANNIGFRCFADATALTSDRFSLGIPTVDAEGAEEWNIPTAEPTEAIEEDIPTAEPTEVTEEEDVPTAEPIEVTEEDVPTAEPAEVSEETGADVPENGASKRESNDSGTGKSDLSEDPRNPTVSAPPAVTESTSEEDEVPTETSGLAVEKGAPVIAKTDGSILMLTENGILASVYAVSVGQYAACVAEDACEMPSALESLAYQNMGDDAKDLPMVYVTAGQAAAYCEWAGMRLPTTAEWRAAAAVDSSAEISASTANCVGTDRSSFIQSENQLALTAPVSSFRSYASLYGMVQMFGNVWEWAQTDEDFPTALGGAWNSYPETLGTDASLQTWSGYSADNIGFRCFADAADLTPDLFEVSEGDVESLLNPGLWSEKGVRAKDRAVMELIPASSFSMGVAGGAVDEKPAHQVSLSAYWIDTYEVTNAQYALCVAGGTCTEPSAVKSFRRASYYGNPEFDNYPVIFVDWNQAEAFCEWVGGRLPTEAEWEFAAKGPDGFHYPWGNTFTASYLNYSGNGDYDTLPVDASPDDVSSFGIFNLGGNVSEWVFDRYQENWYTVTDQPSDPTGPVNGQYRVIRGGSAQTGENNSRTEDRFYGLATSAGADRGFRCVIPDAQQ